MNSQYLTKSELAERWSWSLIERFYPICDKQLYNIHRIRLSESSNTFRIELDKALKRKKAIRELKMMECVNK